MSETNSKTQINEIPNSFPFKEQLLFFKNDLLRELHQTEGKVYQKLEANNLKFIEDISEIQRSIKEIKDKIISLSSSVSTINLMKENLNKVNSSFDKITDNLMTQDIRIKTMNKDLRDAMDKYDKIIIDSLIFPGLVGNQGKFKTLHELIEFLFNNVNKLIAYKDKNYIDLEKNKKKFETLINNFETKSELFTRNSNAFSHKILDVCEESCKNILNNYINVNKRNMNNYKESFDNKINSISNNIKFYFDKINNIEFALIDHFNDYESFKKNQSINKSSNENNYGIRKTNTIAKSSSILKPYIHGTINLNELIPHRDSIDIFGQTIDKKIKMRDSIPNPEFLKNKLILNKFGKNDSQEINKKRYQNRKSCYLENKNSLNQKEKKSIIYNNYQNSLLKRDSKLASIASINKDKDENNEIESISKSVDINNESNSINNNEENKIFDNDSNNKINTISSNKSSCNENNVYNKNSSSKNNSDSKNNSSKNDTYNKNNYFENNNDKNEKNLTKKRGRFFSLYSPSTSNKIKLEEVSKNINEKNKISKKSTINSPKKTFYLRNRNSSSVIMKKNIEDSNNIKRVEYYNKNINKSTSLNKKDIALNVNRKELSEQRGIISLKHKRPKTSKRNSKFLSSSNKPNKKYTPINNKEKTQSFSGNLSNLSEISNKDQNILKDINMNSPNKQLNKVEINFERKLDLKNEKENEIKKITKTFNQIKEFIASDEIAIIMKIFSKYGIDGKKINDK